MRACRHTIPEYVDSSYVAQYATAPNNSYDSIPFIPEYVDSSHVAQYATAPNNRYDNSLFIFLQELLVQFSLK